MSAAVTFTKELVLGCELKELSPRCFGLVCGQEHRSRIRVGGLRNVVVSVPAAVAPGDSVTLGCTYDLEGESLYTVKWYKGRQEFFRYVPKELPHTRVFPLPGVNVDISLSTANQVVLRDVQVDLAGKYRCEVSADAPSFHTEVVASHMHVVYLPEGDPKLTVEKARYSVGDTVRANCSSPPSNPFTNLTWFVNGKKVNETSSRRMRVKSGEAGERVITAVTLEMEIDGSSFRYGKLRLQCSATLFQLYERTASAVLEEERPRLASVLGTRESAAGSTMLQETHWWMFPLVALLSSYGR